MEKLKIKETTLACPACLSVVKSENICCGNDFYSFRLAHVLNNGDIVFVEDWTGDDYVLKLPKGYEVDYEKI